MKELFGFVAEPHRNGYYLVSPATKEGDKVTCYDLSGFLGSWEMKVGGIFFESISGENLCNHTMQTAQAFANSKNRRLIQ